MGDIKKSFREETDKIACVYMKWADPRLNFFSQLISADRFKGPLMGVKDVAGI